MEVIQYQDRKQGKLLATQIAVFGIYISAFFVLIGFETTIFRTLLIIFFVVIGFSDYYYILWPISTIVNDALGTLYMGRGSFVLLTLILFVLRLFLKNHDKSFRVDKHFLSISILMVLWTFYVILFQNRESTDFLYKTLPCVVSFLMIYENLVVNKTVKYEDFFEHVLVSIMLLIVVAVFFGKTTNDVSYVVRQGLLGTGIGDPNYSANKINLAIMIALMDKRIKWFWKAVVVAISVYMLALTASMTGLILLGISILLYLFAEKSLTKTIRRIIIVGVVLLVALYIVLNTGILSSIPQLNAFYTRLSILNGSVAIYGTAGGSGRAGLLQAYIYGFFNKTSVINMLFGGVSLPNPSIAPYYSHNTYIDGLFRFGIVGTVIIIYTIIHRFKNAYYDKQTLLFGCKVSLAIFALSISVYNGDSAALLFAFLIAL